MGRKVAISGRGPATAPEPPLGRLTLVPEPSAAGSGVAGPHRAVVLHATDAAGFRWTLAVPAGAVPVTTRLTLTPASVDSSAARLAVRSGVLFAPDGLVLARPATVSVVAPHGVSTPLVVTADRSGGHLSLARATTDRTGAVSAPIEHFSGAGAATDPGRSALGEQFDALKHDADQVLASPIPAVPAASAPLGCSTDDSGTAAAESFAAAGEPEATLASRLSALAAQLAADGDDRLGLAANTAYALESRIVAKFQPVIDAHGEDPDYLAFSTLAAAALAGFASQGVPVKRLMDTIAAKVSVALGKIVDRFSDDHDLVAIVAFHTAHYDALVIAAAASSVGADGAALESAASRQADRLAKAITFHVKIDTMLHGSDQGADLSLATTTEGDARFPTLDAEPFVMELDLHGTYTSGDFTLGGQESAHVQTPQPFDGNTYFRLTVCPSPQASIDRPTVGADPETWIGVTGRTGTFSNDTPCGKDVVQCTVEASEAYTNGELVVPLTDKSATLADTTKSGSSNDSTVELHVVITAP